MSVRYVPEAEASLVANVVVDGAPNAGTTLVLSHWPGLPVPPGLEADTSAEIVLRYLDAGARLHGDAEVATNNHFDQDGLAGLFALTDPDAALPRRHLLVDLARAGDFATYRDRRAARASMALSAMAAAAIRGRPDADACAELYVDALGRLPQLLDDPDAFRPLWADEDAELDAAERAVASGAVEVREVPDVDLAVIVVDPAVGATGGHRFGGDHVDGLHPMALHSTTACSRLLVAHGERTRFVHRYESWVQYRSRPVPLRVDVALLAEELSAAERDGARWSATPVGGLTQELTTDDGAPSTLPLEHVAAAVTRHLRSAPPAWDPSATRDVTA